MLRKTRGDSCLMCFSISNSFFSRHVSFVRICCFNSIYSRRLQTRVRTPRTDGRLKYDDAPGMCGARCAYDECLARGSLCEREYIIYMRAATRWLMTVGWRVCELVSSRGRPVDCDRTFGMRMFNAIHVRINIWDADARRYFLSGWRVLNCI